MSLSCESFKDAFAHLTVEDGAAEAEIAVSDVKTPRQLDGLFPALIAGVH